MYIRGLGVFRPPGRLVTFYRCIRLGCKKRANNPTWNAQTTGGGPDKIRKNGYTDLTA